MSNKGKEHDDELWFKHQIGGELERFDQAHEIQPPELHEFESLVRSHRQVIKRKQWKELLLLWMIGCVVFGTMMWLLQKEVVWFIALQTVVGCSAVLYASLTFGKRVGQKWNKS